MGEDNIIQEFKLKNIEEIKKYFTKEIDQNELMSKNINKVSSVLNYTEHFLFSVSVITGCVSISASASLVGIPTGITSSEVELKIFAITAGIKNHNSIITKKIYKHDEIVLLEKTKLNNIELLISKALTDSYISHDEFVLVNNVSKEYDDMKQKIKNLKD